MQCKYKEDRELLLRKSQPKREKDIHRSIPLKVFKKRLEYAPMEERENYGNLRKTLREEKEGSYFRKRKYTEIQNP